MTDLIEEIERAVAQGVPINVQGGVASIDTKKVWAYSVTIANAKQL